MDEFYQWALLQISDKTKDYYGSGTIERYIQDLDSSVVARKYNVIGYEKVFDCKNPDEIMSLYEEAIEMRDPNDPTQKSHHTFTSALKLYYAYLLFCQNRDRVPIVVSQKSLARQFENETKKAGKLSDEELEAKAKSYSDDGIEYNVVYKSKKRNPYVAEYYRRRANGICDLCGEESPIIKSDGSRYLESHHIKWLSEGGLDDVTNVVALCPNCHKKVHIEKRKEDITFLKRRAKGYLN